MERVTMSSQEIKRLELMRQLSDKMLTQAHLGTKQRQKKVNFVLAIARLSGAEYINTSDLYADRPALYLQHDRLVPCAIQ